MHSRHLGLGLSALLASTLVTLGTAARAAEPDEDTVEVADDEDETAPSEEQPEEETEVPEPTFAPEPPEDDGSEKKKRGKKTKKGKSVGANAEKKAEKKPKNAKAEDPADAWLPPDRVSGKRYKQAELKKPWIKRWAPERDMLDVGLYMGALFLPRAHGLFDAGEGPRPSLRRGAFDFGGRLAYMPLAFLGVGLETGVMPNHSTSEGADARISAFRMHVIGQLPYRITPTLVLGGGFLAIRSDARILRELDGAFHWGPGLKIHANQWIAVRIDGRHIFTSGDAGSAGAHYGELLVGVDVTLRMRRLIKPRKVDRDDDGWYDRDDACPTESGGDDSDDGCPRNKDSDADGVPDRKDKCPKEYGDDPQGCPIPDKDGDGILDFKDSCEDKPETVNGFDDQDGCPDEAPEQVKKLTGVITGITFDSGKTTIRKSSRGALDSVVKTLKEFPQVRIEITGHTDDQGSREGNVALSSKRAEAVKAYLVAAGIDAARVETRGAGPDTPIADNKTKAGRAKNRRIEFKVIN